MQGASIEFIRVPMGTDTLWVCRKEISEAVYSAVMGNNGSVSELPKTLSWYQAAQFADSLTKKCDNVLQVLIDTLLIHSINDTILNALLFDPVYDSLGIDTLLTPRIIGANYIYCADTAAATDSIPGSGCSASLDTFFAYQGKYFFLFDTLPDSTCLKSLASTMERYSDTLVLYPDTFTVAFYTRIPGNYGFRLPTEEEWETFALAGRGISYSTYNGKLSEESAVYGKSAPANIGSKLSNPYRLYDVTGNLWEWTEDWWSARGIYSVTDSTPKFPAKVIKGGCFSDKASSPNLKTTESYSEHPDSTLDGKIGVRLVIENSVFWTYYNYFSRLNN